MSSLSNATHRTTTCFFMAMITLGGTLLESTAQDFQSSRDGLIPWFRQKFSQKDPSGTSKERKTSRRQTGSPRIPKGGTLIFTDQGPLSPLQLATSQSHNPDLSADPSGPSASVRPHPAQAQAQAPAMAPSIEPDPPAAPDAALFPPVDDTLAREKAALREREQAIAQREAELNEKLEAEKAELARRERELTRQRKEEELRRQEAQRELREEQLRLKEAEAKLAPAAPDSPSPGIDDAPSSTAEANGSASPPPEAVAEVSPHPSPQAAKAPDAASPPKKRARHRPAPAPFFNEDAPATITPFEPGVAAEFAPLSDESAEETSAAETLTVSESAPSGEPTRAEITPDDSPKLGENLPSEEDHFVIARDKTPLYIEGPAQLTPADAFLGRGTSVTLVERREAWSIVKLETGVAGFVASDSLQTGEATNKSRPEDTGDDPAQATAATQPGLHF